MPALDIKNKDGATKELGINGFPSVELTEAGVKFTKPVKVLSSTAGDEPITQSQAFGVGSLSRGITRALSTNYVNTSEKVKLINFEGTAGVANATMIIVVSSPINAYNIVGYVPAVSFIGACQAIVFPGESWSCTSSGFSTTSLTESS